MTIEQKLRERSGSSCELCTSTEKLSVYDVPAQSNDVDRSILICSVCKAQINSETNLDVNHWRCLNNSMWSSIPAVQVTVWRLLNKLKDHGWPQDLLDMLYLDDDVLAWAKMTTEAGENSAEEKVVHKDSHGAILESGDTVVLIKDLDVKGGGFTAKRGTAVKGISLVQDNANQIEGRINGQQIVILTQYVKKS
ncbi:MAG: PhnA domain-containing protein [Bacteroidota bacterium]